MREKKEVRKEVKQEEEKFSYGEGRKEKQMQRF